MISDFGLQEERLGKRGGGKMKSWGDTEDGSQSRWGNEAKNQGKGITKEKTGTTG